MLNEEELVKKNQEFNEELFFVLGACYIYKAIQGNALYEIYQEIFGKTEEEFGRLLMFIDCISEKIQITLEEETPKVAYLCSSKIDKKQAKRIIENKKELYYQVYTKNEYIQFGREDFFTS